MLVGTSCLIFTVLNSNEFCDFDGFRKGSRINVFILVDRVIMRVLILYIIFSKNLRILFALHILKRKKLLCLSIQFI